MLRIIDNKRIDLTDGEFQVYQAICASYPQGADLFRGLFETDNEGIIVFIHAPTKLFSMQVLEFLRNIMIHQHLRKMHSEVEKGLTELREKINEVSSLLQKKD